MGTPSAQTLVEFASGFFRVLEEVPMTMIGGFDVHRKQITFDYVDDDGLVRWGQIRPATRTTLRGWLGEHCPEVGGAEFALEGCTGWRYVSEELAAAGVGVHLGDPAEIATLRGPKKRAKDRPRRCAAIAHAAAGRAVPGVVDSARARAGDPHVGPVVLRADGRAPRLAAAHPCPVVPPGLPTGQGAAVGGGPRRARGCRAVGGGTAIRGYCASPHR